MPTPWANPMPQLPCLLESIDEFGVNNLAAFWQIQSLSFQPDIGERIKSESPEEDVDRLINNALQVVWSEFPDMVTQTITGLMQGPALDSLNGFFERTGQGRWEAFQEIPSIPQIDWQSSNQRLLDRALDQGLVNSIDQFYTWESKCSSRLSIKISYCERGESKAG